MPRFTELRKWEEAKHWALQGEKALYGFRVLVFRVVGV